jgi:hypothetical protein
VIGFLKSPNYPHWVELTRAENVFADLCRN